LIAANVVAIVRRELARHDDPQEEPAAIADVLGEPVPVGAARRVRSVRGREGNGLRGMARCAPRECHHATAAELPGIGCPVALVRASEGFHPRSPPLFGRRTLERLHACIRLHRDVVLSGATHSSMLFNRDG
jgi:hypothetical protein